MGFMWFSVWGICLTACWGVNGLCESVWNGWTVSVYGAMFDSVLGVNGLCESVWNGWTVSVYGAMFDSVLGVNGLCESVWNGGTVSIIGGSCHKCHLCRDKSMLVVINCLSRQKTCFGPDKTCACGSSCQWQCHGVRNMTACWCVNGLCESVWNGRAVSVCEEYDSVLVCKRAMWVSLEWKGCVSVWGIWQRVGV